MQKAVCIYTWTLPSFVLLPCSTLLYLLKKEKKGGKIHTEFLNMNMITGRKDVYLNASKMCIEHIFYSQIN